MTRIIMVIAIAAALGGCDLDTAEQAIAKCDMEALTHLHGSDSYERGTYASDCMTAKGWKLLENGHWKRVAQDWS
jgi:hypothetical protein